MPGQVPHFGLPGLTRGASHVPAPVFDTDVPLFIGAVRDGAAGGPLAAIPSAAEFEGRFGPTPGHLSDAIAGFFRNGGRRAVVAALAERTTEALAAALEALRARPDIDLVCAPDLTSWPEGQLQILAHLADGSAQFALLDAPEAGPGAPAELPAELRPAADACAVYGPWVVVSCLACGGRRCPRCNDTGVRSVPPSGLVAGTFARVGPGVAPANLLLEGALDVAAADGPGNRLTVQPGRGVRVWGARTLGGRDIAAVRLLQTVVRWARDSLVAVAFEPNTSSLGLRVRRTIEAFLHHLHRADLLAGATPEDAFTVVCDERNNPQASLQGGRLVVDIQLTIPRTIQQVHVHLVRVDGRVTVAALPP